MNEYKLDFPELKWIKSHPRHPNKKDKEEYKEYEWVIFDFGNSYCRIKYNEDDNGKFYLDMMQDGCCDRWNVLGDSYPATVQGYKELKEHCEEVYNRLIKEVLISNNLHKEYWE